MGYGQMTTWTNDYGQITTDNLLQDKWLHGQMTTCYSKVRVIRIPSDLRDLSGLAENSTILVFGDT